MATAAGVRISAGAERSAGDRPRALRLASVRSDPTSADAIARAQNWLIETQRDDGGWPIDITHVSKVDRSAPAKADSVKNATGIFTYWGSGWATIGLLQGVPMK